MQNLTSRRSLLVALGVGTAAGLLSRSGSGAEPAKLDSRDPAATALGYVEDAAKVDVKKYPAYVMDSNCANCLQLQGKPGGDYRPCGLFAGKLVAVAGWCSGWTAEM